MIAGAAGRAEGAALAGAVGTLAGFVVFGPVAVRPAATVLGAPIAALRGVGGRLARDNALRNPRRTAATASALMVGVAVVTMFTVIGASLKASAAQGVQRTLTADLVVYQPGYGGSAGLAGFSPELAAGLARMPSVGVAAGMSRGSVLLGGQAQTIAAAGWAPHTGRPLDSMVLIKLKPGAGLGAARTAVTAATAAAGQPRVQDQAQYRAAGGVILGTFLGWAVVRSSSSAALGVFAAPPLQLVLFLVLGAVTGILAGIRPARRAARLNMISAIAAA